MEFLGVSLAVVSLVLQIAELYEKIKNHSIEFHRLDQDLKCFYDALVLAKHYLHHQALHRTRIACQDIAYDVKTLLWKRQRQVSWARSIFKVSSSEIQQLRDRMHFQLTNLHHSASELRWRVLEPGHVLTATSKTTSNLALRDLGSLQSQERTEQHPSLLPVVLRSASSIFPSPNASSSGLPSLRSASSRRSSASSRSYATGNTNLVSSQTGSSTPMQWPIDTGLQAAKECNVKANCDWLIALAQRPRIHEDDMDEVKTLLYHGALLEYRDAVCGRTPLIWAIMAGRKDLIALFLDTDASVIEIPDGSWDWTPTIWAVTENQNEILSILIRRGADLNKADSNRKRTALMWAASSGRHDAVRSLIASKRARIDLADGEGMTPLASAYFGGHWKTARLLLEAGDSANAKVRGASLLEWAIIASDRSFVQVLLKHGAIPNITNSEGIPLLILAIKRNSPDIVELMVDAEADVQCADKSGFTALMWAIWHSNQRIVAILVHKNANPTAVDGKGTTVQALAKQVGDQAILQLVSRPG